MGQWAMFSDFGDSYRIYRACLSLNPECLEEPNVVRKLTSTPIRWDTGVSLFQVQTLFISKPHSSVVFLYILQNIPRLARWPSFSEEKNYSAFSCVLDASLHYGLSNVIMRNQKFAKVCKSRTLLLAHFWAKTANFF